MSRQASYTQEQLIHAIQDNISMAATLRALGLTPKGGNYKTIKTKIRKLGLSVSHWKGQAHARHTTILRRPKYTLDQILVAGSTYTNMSRLKKRLVRAGLLAYACSECDLRDLWKGKPLVLHLDHINGVHDDHRLENLRFLCPNCHTQTETYTGRKLRKPARPCPDCGGPKGSSSTRCQPCSVSHRWGQPAAIPIQCPAGTRAFESDSPEKLEGVCPGCRGSKSSKAKKCRSCAGFGRRPKAQWPPLGELAKRVAETSYRQVGKELGVSDNAVRKHLRLRNL